MKVKYTQLCIFISYLQVLPMKNINYDLMEFYDVIKSKITLLLIVFKLIALIPTSVYSQKSYRELESITKKINTKNRYIVSNKTLKVNFEFL